jgi:hypothetical protein
LPVGGGARAKSTEDAGSRVLKVQVAGRSRNSRVDTASTLAFMREVEYRSSGVPLEEYELTRGDHRRQKQSEEISESVRRQVEEDNAKCRADPARAERRRQAFENVAKLMQSFKKADHEIMRWRVRLYCGHIIETEAHYTYTDPLSAGAYGRRCSECGEDRQTIVAFEPIGLRGEPPEPTESTPPPPPKKPTRADLERRVKTLEKENERLRAKLSD